MEDFISSFRSDSVITWMLLLDENIVHVSCIADILEIFN